MLLHRSKYFKTLSMIKCPFIVKQKVQGTIPNGNTGLSIRCIGDKNIVQMLGRILQETEIILDEVLKIKIGLAVLDFRKLKIKRFSRAERRCQGRGDKRHQRQGRFRGYGGRYRCCQGNLLGRYLPQGGRSGRPEGHGDVRSQ
jgi:hypothetical protein